MKLCAHKPCDYPLNADAPDDEMLYCCTKCGKTVKPIFGLGEKGVMSILLIIVGCIIRTPWFIALQGTSRSDIVGWGRWLLPWVGIAALFVNTNVFIQNRFVPICKVVKGKTEDD